MRFLALAAIALAAACAGPRPCTQALCPTSYASYRVTGWNRSVTVSSGTPAIPIVSDSAVDVIGGEAQFVNGKSVVTASAGTTFTYLVSSSAVSSIVLSSGSMTVAIDSAPAASVPLGAATFLPVWKK